MPLPNSYTQKPNSIASYFDTILDAQAPERFSIKFLENLGFQSTNDRLFISILKDLGFLNADGTPQQRYFEFLDRSQSKKILAAAIRDAYSDLFAVNTNSNTLSDEEVKNKLRTLYAGKKSDSIIAKIASTFTSLCEYADFSATPPRKAEPEQPPPHDKPNKNPTDDKRLESVNRRTSLAMDSLQYHINIVLPESRDPSVYDAIFKSLREHLG